MSSHFIGTINRCLTDVFERRDECRLMPILWLMCESDLLESF